MADAFTVALVAGGFGLVGAALGVAGGYVLEIRRGQEARTERLERRQQQRDDLQRQTLMDFQEALGQYVKAVGASLPTPAQVEAGTHRITQEVSTREFDTGGRAQMLAQRIRDDELRKRFSALWDVAHTNILIGRGVELAAFIHDLVEKLNAVEDRLGSVLRPYL